MAKIGNILANELNKKSFFPFLSKIESRCELQARLKVNVANRAVFGQIGTYILTVLGYHIDGQ